MSGSPCPSGTSVLLDPWAALRPDRLTVRQMDRNGVELDEDYRTRLLPLVYAVERDIDVPRYEPARHSLIARLPRPWTEPRAEHLVQLVAALELEDVVSVAALQRWPSIAHVTLAMLPGPPEPTAVVDLAPLPVHVDGLFLGGRRTVGRGYAVVRLDAPGARALAWLREALGSHPPRPLMGGVLHLRRDVSGGSPEAAGLARVVQEADDLLHDDIVLTQLDWNATHDDMTLTADRRSAVPPGAAT